MAMGFNSAAGPWLRRHDVSPLRGLSPGRVALAAFVLLYLSWQAMHWIPLPQELVGGASLLTMTLIAAGAAARTSWAASSSRVRRAWRWIALALLAEAAAEATQSIYELSHVYTYPTLADPLYLCFYPLLLVGILTFPTPHRTARQALELAIDGAIVMFGGGAVFVYVILGPEAIAAHTPLETIVSIAYPVGDLMLLVALGAALMRGPLPETLRSLRAMTLGMASFAVADLIYGYIELHGVYHGGDPVDILYLFASVCMIVAASRQGETVGESDLLPEVRATDSRRSWLPYLAIAVSVTIMVVAESGQPFFPDISMSIILALTAVLAVLRQLLFQASLRRSRARLAHAQKIAQIGSWEWDVARDLIKRSAEDRRLYGLADRDLPATRGESIAAIHPDDRERVDQLVEESLRIAKPFAYEMRIVRPDGEVRTLLTRGEVHAKAGRVTRVVGTHQDITERKQMEVQLRHQADHDPLTGLYNRRRLAAELDRVLGYACRYDRSGALLVLDLDNFKLLNDTRGHVAGDTALKALGQAIRGRVRAFDIVARLGGDEFVVVLPEVDEAQALAIAEDIRQNVAERDIDSLISISGGIVMFGGERELIADDILIAADIALYEAKERGKDQVCVYRGSAGAAMLWVDRVRTALNDGRFVLFGQPIVDLRTGVIAHNELLIRMISDDGDIIPPSAFLPTAERFGLINDIDRWVTREGLRLAREGERVSINLAARSIGDEQILAMVRGAIADGLAPADVMFEITETGAMRNMDEARAFTEALTSLGCHVALDDFGTGFGSFTYLKHLPARYLKIDMEFVREMVSNITDRQVVESITKVAHSLGKLTIAEGVEDAATLEVLRDYGVDRAQGFFVGRPKRISPPTRFEQTGSRQLAAAAD